MTMRNASILWIPFLIAWFITANVNAQNTTIEGHVTDAKTKEPIAGATISFFGTHQGCVSDEHGRYVLSGRPLNDSLQFSYIGYQGRLKRIRIGFRQIVDLTLTNSGIQLSELVVRPTRGENPAWAIIRHVILNKPINDPDQLEAYQCTAYTLIQASAIMNDKMLKNQKAIKKTLSVLNPIRKSANDSSLNQIPMYFSETLSDFYFNAHPLLKKGIIRQSRVKGIGLGSGTAISQLVATSLVQFNFYQNRVSIFKKEFVSPIGAGWRSYYKYSLVDDSDVVAGVVCYRINFVPKNPEALAFTGTLWITKNGYALRKISTDVVASADINFISNVQINQTLQPVVKEKYWLPASTRVKFNVTGTKNNTSGFVISYLIANTGVRTDSVKNASFFNRPVEVANNADAPEEKQWESVRPLALTDAEKRMPSLIDTMKNIPIVRDYIRTIDIVLSGYVTYHQIDFGPYFSALAVNNVEGLRVQVGLRTNSSFSKKWTLQGYLAKGTKDAPLKYAVSANYIFSRQPFTQARVFFSYDLDQVALQSESYLLTKNNNLFKVSTNFGDVYKRKPFYSYVLGGFVEQNFLKNVNLRMDFNHKTFSPLFDFRYPQTLSNPASLTNFSTSELRVNLTFYPGATPIANNTKNRQVVYLDNSKLLFKFNYTHGLPGVLGSVWAYNKFAFSVKQTLLLGFLGRGSYIVNGGYIPSRLPFLLLENHLGNNSIIYNHSSFNNMNFFEFISDRYASLGYDHHFQGFIINSIPLLKALKWRFVASGNVLFGGLSRENKQATDILTYSVRPLGHEPYVEAGYGIENIFKFIRIDFIHRLTYLDRFSGGAKPAHFKVLVSGDVRF